VNNTERLNNLAVFLAGLDNPTIDINTSRPPPDALINFFVRGLLRHVRELIGTGQGNVEKIYSILETKLRTLRKAEAAMDKVWQAYDSDESLHAYISTLITANDK